MLLRPRTMVILIVLSLMFGCIAGLAGGIIMMEKTYESTTGITVYEVYATAVAKNDYEGRP